jgi:hypothetical protein
MRQQAITLFRRDAMLFGALHRSSEFLSHKSGTTFGLTLCMKSIIQMFRPKSSRGFRPNNPVQVES